MSHTSPADTRQKTLWQSEMVYRSRQHRLGFLKTESQTGGLYSGENQSLVLRFASFRGSGPFVAILKD